jgi:uncharacterized protein (DUF111 family)
MSKILYFDCFAGASGDMVLGALLDAGLPLAELEAALGSLMIPGYRLSADHVPVTRMTTGTATRTRTMATVPCRTSWR